MSVERVVAKLEEDAAQETAALLEQARRRAEEVALAAEREAVSIRKSLRERGRREAEAARLRILTDARLKARAELARARRAAVEEVFDEARRVLGELPESAYRERLLEVLLEVARGGEELVLNPRDRERLGTWLSEQAAGRGLRLSLSAETRPLIGGFVLLAGPVEINASLDVTLERLRDELEPGVAAVLFGGKA